MSGWLVPKVPLYKTSPGLQELGQPVPQGNLLLPGCVWSCEVCLHQRGIFCSLKVLRTALHQS